MVNLKERGSPMINNKPIKAATPIHFVEYHQCPRRIGVSLVAFVFRGFLCCSRFDGEIR